METEPIGERFDIRTVKREDEPSLAAIERAAPECGQLAVRLRPRVGYLDLVARYPGVRGHVALAADSRQIIGMLFSSVAPTQFNGAVVSGVYLFSLRVHPAARRRGVASALISHALDQARGEAGVEVAWAAVMADNEPSLRAFSRVGFARARDLAIRVRLPGGREVRGDSKWTLRQATELDLPSLADGLNRANARHNLWRPSTPHDLAAQLTAAGHSLSDVLVVVDHGGDIGAAGAVLDLRRVLAPRFLEHRRLPRLVNRALSLLVSAVPLHPLVLRQRALSLTTPEAALRLVRAVQRRYAARLSVLAVPVDPFDPAWPLIAPATQFGRPLHVMVKSTTPLDESRPLALT